MHPTSILVRVSQPRLHSTLISLDMVKSTPVSLSNYIFLNEDHHRLLQATLKYES
jgi:hypothetical protein